MLPSLAAMLMGSTAALAVPVALPAHSFHEDHVLGTSLDVTLVSASDEMAALAMQAIQAEIARLDPILSGWRNDSELALLNRTGRHTASPELFAVVASGEAWREKSGGAFNLGLGTLTAAAPEARGTIAATLQQASLTLEPQTRTIQRPQELQLAVDGIAKGYIIDRALEAARSVPGIQGAMIDIGGDLRCWGAAPNGAAWRIGIADPQNLADNAAPCAAITVSNAAVATSGTGARRHAILDPLTGEMRRDVLMATAVAPTAADADALATIFHVLPPEQSLALADSLPGVAAHVIGADGTAHASQGWVRLAQNGAPRPGMLAPAWPAGFSLKIDYEIPQITGGRRVRVPYVTIWITNAAGEPVRTLAYYADKLRFMRENYVFWEKIGAANPGLVDSVTRPTRPPGAYSISWDGRDDAGKPVPQGHYTVNVEASREHGGHNIQRIEIDLGAAPANGAAAAQQEIGAIKVTYGK
jgi:thiamine biosynthesis lipoprotein